MKRFWLVFFLFFLFFNKSFSQIENFSIGGRPSFFSDNFGDKLGFLQFSYEAQLENLNDHISAGVHTRIFTDNFSGVSFDFFGRWYFKPKVSDIDGWYLQPKIGYNISKVNFETPLLVSDRNNFFTYGAGLALGRKFLMWDYLTFDVYTGYNYVSQPTYKLVSNANIFPSSYQQDLDESWIATFGFPLELKFTIGFIID